MRCGRKLIVCFEAPICRLQRADIDTCSISKENAPMVTRARNQCHFRIARTVIHKLMSKGKIPWNVEPSAAFLASAGMVQVF